MKNFKIVLLTLFSLSSLVVYSQVPFYGEYKSPSKNVMLKLFQKDGRSFFSVYLNNKLVVDNSIIGLETSYGSFYSDLSLEKKPYNKVKTEKYSLVVSKVSNVKKKYREIVYHVVNLQKKQLDLIFRIFDDGVAYSYGLKGRGECTVFKEYGNFTFPLDTRAYMTPYSKPKSGWAKTNPSYEEHYVYDVPVNTISSIGNGWTYPALFNVPGNGWVLVSETGTDGNYCGTHLSEPTQNGIYKIEFPSVEEGLYNQNVYPVMVLPFQTPWRMMIVGKNPVDIAGSTMATDLVKPLFKAKSEYKAGRATWSWVVLKDDSVNYDVTRKFIDMASHLDFEYCLVDAPWDVNIGKEKIEELSKYAQTRNVGLLLWYNSNGNWNDAPQTPKGYMDNADIRRKEMKWMQSIGIKGVKVDFFGGDKQFYMKYYQDLAKDANDFGLTVNFHGTTLPRGWERMYPNFVTNEAVKGMEFITFGQEDADMQAKHCATLPFIRNVAGPMDFTPVILNERLGSDRKSGPLRRTTVAFELALPVLFLSGVQHFGIIPENLKQYDFFLTDYIRDVPATWDDTKFLYGMPGKDCVVARRSGSKWYIAGINGESFDKEISFDVTNFIKTGTSGYAIVEKNGDKNQIERIDLVVPNKKKPMEVKLSANSGFVMIFETAKK